MLKKATIFFLVIAFVFSFSPVVFGFGETYETLIASDAGDAPGSILGTYVWNSGNNQYEHETEVYFIEEYTTEEYWIHDGVEPLYSSVGELYGTNYHNFGVEGYEGTVAIAGGELFEEETPAGITFAGLGATLNPTEIGGHMVDLFAEVWVIVALALAMPLVFYFAFKLRENMPVEAKEKREIKRISEKARREHEREIRKK